MADIKPSYDSTHPHWNLDSVVAELRMSREGKHRTRHPKGLRELPSRTAMAQVIAKVWLPASASCRIRYIARRAAALRAFGLRAPADRALETEHVACV
ncbi:MULTISPECIES: hypothetical protein [Burkholderiaceae]|uniref:hypothetical protein n=1 Tax=Burkholderiaceae TaxID=119060 RepID=UPI00147CCB04|nr:MULTISPECIES: hypothetical protein [Burkholderiaceae]MCG1040681.1 hypothetical protein [Mycetohabitans sp. B7]